jgi:predicted nucleic acid-binding protein
VTSPADQVLIFDATSLSHFSRAERLDVLRDLLAGRPCLTTRVVHEELRAGIGTFPALRQALDAEWLGMAELSTLQELECFARWVRRVGSSGRDLGEASVFSAAELLGGIAITDDRDATAVGRAYGLEVHGTIWLLGTACREGKLTQVGAENLVDALRATGMRLPCSGSTFLSYARRYRLC